MFLIYTQNTSIHIRLNTMFLFLKYNTTKN
jgi:hypothetical protein